MGRVTINGTVAQFSCKQTIPKELWDAKGNKAKGKGKEARATLDSWIKKEFIQPSRIVDIEGDFFQVDRVIGQLRQQNR